MEPGGPPPGEPTGPLHGEPGGPPPGLGEPTSPPLITRRVISAEINGTIEEVLPESKKAITFYNISCVGVLNVKTTEQSIWCTSKRYSEFRQV